MVTLFVVIRLVLALTSILVSKYRMDAPLRLSLAVLTKMLVPRTRTPSWGSLFALLSTPSWLLVRLVCS